MTNKVYSYKNLIVWKKSMQLVVEVYSLTKDYPREELYGLIINLEDAPFQFLQILLKAVGEEQKKILGHF
jgi:hypothetical protein